MAMTFYSSIDTTILFNGWTTNTVGQYVGALVAVILMGIGRQGLAWARKQLPAWISRGHVAYCSSDGNFYQLASKPLTYGTHEAKCAAGDAEACCCDEGATVAEQLSTSGSCCSPQHGLDIAIKSQPVQSMDVTAGGGVERHRPSANGFRTGRQEAASEYKQTQTAGEITPSYANAQPIDAV